MKRVLISEVSLRKIFPGWRAAYDHTAHRIWHEGWLDDEDLIQLPHVGVNVELAMLKKVAGEVIYI